MYCCLFGALFDNVISGQALKERFRIAASWLRAWSLSLCFLKISWQKFDKSAGNLTAPRHSQKNQKKYLKSFKEWANLSEPMRETRKISSAAKISSSSFEHMKSFRKGLNLFDQFFSAVKLTLFTGKLILISSFSSPSNPRLEVLQAPVASEKKPSKEAKLTIRELLKLILKHYKWLQSIQCTRELRALKGFNVRREKAEENQIYIRKHIFTAIIFSVSGFHVRMKIATITFHM